MNTQVTAFHSKRVYIEKIGTPIPPCTKQKTHTFIRLAHKCLRCGLRCGLRMRRCSYSYQVQNFMNFAVLFGACACCGAILRLYCSYNVLINYRPCTVIIDGDVWFVAKDVCDVLGIQRTNDATCGLDDDEKVTEKIRTPKRV